MSKHTTGPWYVEQPWSGFSAIRTVKDNLLIFGLAAGSEEERRPDAECHSNARLIAAAPEMYRALEDMIERFTTCAIALGSDAEHVELATAKARAVLAKVDMDHG